MVRILTSRETSGSAASGQRRERNFHSNPAFSRVRVLRRERNFHSNPAFSRVRVLRREAFFIGFDRARALSAVSAASASLSAWPALLLSAVSAASACERTALRSAKQQGAIATQGPRAEKLANDFRILTGGEVWRESGPPAPTSITFSRQPAIFPLLPIASRRSRNFSPRYRFPPSERPGTYHAHWFAEDL